MLMNKLVKAPKAIAPRHLRLLATQAMPKREAEALPGTEVRYQTLLNGMIVAAAENNNPVSQVSFVIKAGTRYEPADKLGLSHALRTSMGLSTRNATVFGITRNLELKGCSLTASGDREQVSITLTGLREHVAKHLNLLIDSVIVPTFKPWELVDYVYPRMKLDIAARDADADAILMDALHQAAFKGTLSRPLLSPSNMVGKHKHQDLIDYLEAILAPTRVAVVGGGVELERLVEVVQKNIDLPVRSEIKTDGRFLGSQVRIENNSPLTRVAVVVEGAAAKQQKEVAALQLFQELLGSGPRVKYSNGGLSTKLGQAASQVADHPVAVSSLNINYSDCGIIGFTTTCSSKETHKVVKAVATRMRDVAKSITDQDLAIAKAQLKAAILLNTESQGAIVEDLATQATSVGSLLSPREQCRVIDSISAADVNQIVGKALKGKGAMAAVGRLYNTPYLDELA